MNKIAIILFIALFLFSSCTVSPTQQETSEPNTNDTFEETVQPETEPYVVTTEMFGEIYPVVEDTWHLSEWQYIPIKRFWFYEPIDFSPEAMKTYVKLPLEYEEIVDGITVKVEFFQETYPIFSYIQARITYTNNTGISLKFVGGGNKNRSGYFASDAEIYAGIYESPDFDYITGANSKTLVENGQSHVVEVIYLFTNRFDPSKADHRYGLDVYFEIPNSGYPPQSLQFTISFPIEVLRYE